MGRTLGFILLAGGTLVAIVIGALMVIYSREGSLTGGAAMLGFVLGFGVLVLPQWAAGIYFLASGKREQESAARASDLRELLGIVKTRGKVHVDDLAIELKASRDNVHDMIHELVGMGLYSGYINWDEGMLYSSEASELRQLERCRHCNGQLELAGKGVIRCPYCGTEYYLS